jgi:hypothetical protein
VTREKCRALDKLAMVFVEAWDKGDWRTKAFLWSAADYDPDLEDMLFSMSYELDQEQLQEQLQAVRIDGATESASPA